jgi:hypothetical protein
MFSAVSACTTWAAATGGLWWRRRGWGHERQDMNFHFLSPSLQKSDACFLMHIAIIADWLVTYGGAEHTIAAFREIWPESALFTTVTHKESLGPLSKTTLCHS